MQNATRTALLHCTTLLLTASWLSGVANAQLAATEAPQGTTPSLVAALDSSSSSGSLGLSSSSAGPADLPDAPQASSSQPPEFQSHQTKRILGIIPNFRSVSADVKLPPQSAKDKFVTASQDSLDYSSILLPAMLAGYSQARNSTPEFRQGAAGYGRYFWHSAADQTIENYAVEFIVPVLTHEDTRYYTMGRGGFLKRTEYSLSRALITRKDDGHETFNISEVLGAGMAAGISNLYYPSAQRSFGDTAGKWGQSVGVDAATFMAKEFWPDINRKIFRYKGD